MEAFSTKQKTRCDGDRIVPITRDFLRGTSEVGSIELDLDLHVPPGWEKFLELETGKLSIRRVAPFPNKIRPSCPRAHAKPPLNLDLELGVAAKTPSNALPIHECATYRSVITLDDVRSALKSSSTALGSASRKRPDPTGSSSTSSSIGSILDPFGNVKVAATCPACLMYVMVLETDHKCPSCGNVVPMMKKPRVDMNLSIQK